MHADLASHHIEGIAHQGNTPFSVSLISHIDGNLWTGGCIDGVRLPHDFRFVLSLYPWEKYRLAPRTARLEVKLYDSADLPDPDQLRFLADVVGAALDHGPTLGHCEAGLNRSGLLGALALCRRGWEVDDAIALLREKRCSAVLCNAAFEGWLRENA